MRSDKQTRRITGLAGLILAAALTGGATGCGGHEPDHAAIDERAPLTVTAAAATAEDWNDGIVISAGVQPYQRAMPSTVLMGRVDTIERKEGDRVKKGQMLARIDSSDVSARVAQAEAAVAAARAMEQNAKLMKGRMERLQARNAATQKDLDDATAGYEAAGANLRAAEEGVKAAQSYLTYSEIKAPFAGVITERMIEVGDMASPGRPLFVIEDTSRVKIEGQVPESVAAGLAPGDPLEVEIGGESFDAELTELLPTADPRSRTFTARVLMNNPDGKLRSGMFARLKLGGKSRSLVTAPANAIVSRGPLTGIFVVADDSTARLRWVTLGNTRNGMVEVLSGLKAGERVVLEPATALEDGRPVEVR